MTITYEVEPFETASGHPCYAGCWVHCAAGPES